MMVMYQDETVIAANDFHSALLAILSYKVVKHNPHLQARSIASAVTSNSN